VEIEVSSIALLKQALAQTPDVIMLDNFSPEQIQQAVEIVAGRCEIEVSGSIQLENISKYALPGVHYISVGRLTHSAPSLDISLEMGA
jgi:nicotinate-nucleotide pyrophosphorylase (carboxylating)